MPKDDVAKTDDTKTDSRTAVTPTGVPADAQRKSFTRKRIVTTRPPTRAVEGSADDTPRRDARPVYDYFWGNSVRDGRDDEAPTKGAALSGMKPPHSGHAARNTVTKSRYVRGRRAPIDVDDTQDARRRPDYRRGPYEERDRGGFFGHGNWRDDGND
jgi:hypothetical protein